VAKRTPEETKFWEGVARKYLGTMQKLQTQQNELQGLLDSTSEAVRMLGTRTEPGAEFMRLQLRVLELSLRQLDVWDLNMTEFAPTKEADSPAYELRAHELDRLVILQALITLTKLHQLVSADLPLLAAGEPAPAGAPEAWLAERAILMRDEQRRANWERFVTSFASFQFQAQGIPEAPTTEPGAERLAWLRKHVPSLKGAHYRVNGTLRVLPEGEAILAAVKGAMINELQLDPAKRPGRQARTGPAITDRLRDLFKPPTKK